MNKRIVSIALALLMSVSSLPQSALFLPMAKAASTEAIFLEMQQFPIGDDTPDGTTGISGTFRYGTSNKNAQGELFDATARYYYTDEYFHNSSYAVWDSSLQKWSFDDSLATMSLCFQLSAWASTEDGVNYSNKSKNAQALLTEIGFTDFEASPDYNKRPERDSIGAVAAQKQVSVEGQQYTLIALAIRGGGYGAEWASNFTLGLNGQHAGFEKARDDVLSFIRDYASRHNITGDVKLWLTGYSRAAATANLLAGALVDGSSLGDGIELQPEDLYAFCFETPRGALHSYVSGKSQYNNIINIINPNDIVTEVAPAAAPFGFSRYGINIILPTAENSSNYGVQRQDMLKQYNEMEATNSYIVDDFQMKKWDIQWQYIVVPVPGIYNDTKNNWSQGHFIQHTITTIAIEQLKNRSNYVNSFQADIREALAIMNGSDEAQWDDFNKRFSDKLSSPGNLAKIIAAAIIPGCSLIFGSPVAQIENLAYESLGEAGISTYNRNQIHSMALSLSSLVVKFAVSHPNLTTTLISNFDSIGSAHDPELCLAWLQSRDPNYTSDAFWTGTSGAYRIIRINCPIDFEVYSSGEIVASFVADDSLLIADDSQSLFPSSLGSGAASENTLVYGIDDHGEKYIILPADEDYELMLTATDDGEMTFSISEYSPELGGVARILNYYDLPITTGTTFAGDLPSYDSSDIENGAENGSTVEYLLSSNGIEIKPDEEIIGENVIDFYFMVDVRSENENLGFVTGTGVRHLGSFAQANAYPFEACEFQGWYIGDELVSSSAEYRFPVKDDVDLLARFSGTEKYALSISSGAEGKISEGMSGFYESGAIVSITAEADDGYVFKNWTSSSGGSFSNATDATTTFTMPENATAVIAIFESSGGNRGYRTPSSGRDGGPSPAPPNQSSSDVDSTNADSTNMDSTNDVPLSDLPGSHDIGFAETLANDLRTLGLFLGVSETDFGLGRPPTRTEALIMLIRVLGKESEALNGDYEHPFTDVAVWADKYVGYAYVNKLTNGVSATAFGTGDATAAMYLTFVLRALGYSDTDGSDFTWNNPFALGKTVGILPDCVDTSSFWRSDVVIVSYASLAAKLKNSTQTLADKLIGAGVFSRSLFDSTYDPDAIGNYASPAEAATVEVKIFYSSYDEELNENILEYVTVPLRVSNISEDTSRFMLEYNGIVVDSIWYEGSRIYVDLNEGERAKLDRGSEAGNVGSNILLRTFSSYPGVEEIVILIDGEHNSYGNHFNFDGAFIAETYASQ